MASVNQQLLSKLKTSLPKPTPPAPAAKEKINPPVAAPPAPPAQVQPATPKPAKHATPATCVRAPKLSVAVYPFDMSRIDAMKAFMSGKGFRNLSDSEVLRLACRAVKIDDQLPAIYEKMREEDGRRRR